MPRNCASLRRNSVRFLMEKGYLESRVHVDRDDNGQDLSLTVQNGTRTQSGDGLRGCKAVAQTEDPGS